MKILVLFLILLFFNLCFKKKKESFRNYLVIDNNKKNFYMDFISYILEGKKPNYLVYKNHLIHNNLNPIIVDNNYKYFKGYPFMNPSNRNFISI